MANPLNFFHFKNEDEENDRRVRLVPKSPDASLEPKEGEPLEMMNLGADGYGFCLSKAAGITCVGAQPSAKVYQLQRKDGGTIPPSGNTILIDGVEFLEPTMPTWLVITPAPATQEDYDLLGLTPDGPYDVAVITISTTTPVAHRFEIRITPADQDVVSFRTFDPMVLITETGFGVCIKGGAPEPVCNWARIGLMISPDLFYGDSLLDGEPNIGGVYDVTWSVEVNGTLLPQTVEPGGPGKSSYLEDVLKTVPGIIADYAYVSGQPLSGTYMANDTAEAIKIRLIPNKLFPRDRVNFKDIPSEAVLAEIQQDPPVFTNLVPVEHGSVFMAEDCSINICLAPKGTVPPKGITCVGASPYLIAVFAMNPSPTVNVGGVEITVDDVSTGNMGLPPDLFETTTLEATGLTQEQVLAFAKENAAIPDGWQLMVAGVMLSKSASNHIVKAHLTPSNQDQYRYLFYSPWGNELYSDGGMGLCVREGASVPRPKPFQCGSGTNAIFIKTPTGFPTPTGSGFRLVESSTTILEGGTLNSFANAINASNHNLTATVVGDIGIVIRNIKPYQQRQIAFSLDAGLPVDNDYQFFDVANSSDYDQLSSGGYQEVVDRLTEPSLNTFYDETDGSIKFCLKPITPDRWWIPELQNLENNEIITELDANYLDLSIDWFYPGGGLPTGYNLNVQISNQAICTFVGNSTPGLLRFNIQQVVGSTDITITHLEWSNLPPIVFRITKVTPKNKVRTLKLEQNNHYVLDGDGAVIGVDPNYNLIGGVSGKYAYLTFTAIYENSSSQPIDEEVLVCTSEDPSKASAVMVALRDLEDLWDGAAGKYRRVQRGLIRIAFNQVGETNISIVPKRPTFTAVTPIVYNVTSIGATGDMVLQVLTQQDKTCTIEVQGGTGMINWGDGNTSEYGGGQNIFTHAFSSVGVKQEVTITANSSISYLKADGFDNILKWPDVSIAQFRLPTVMNVPVELPTGVTTLANTYRDNIYFNSVIEEYNTTGIADFSYICGGAISFDQNVGNWNTSAATTFAHAFESTSITCVFHNDFSNVVDMSYMFYNAKKWKGGITSRNLHKVTNMDNFAKDALTENRDVGQSNIGMFTAPWPTFAHLEVPLIVTRPVNFRFDDSIVGGISNVQDGPTDPVWGKIHVYNSETTYTQDNSRVALYGHIQMTMSRFQGQDPFSNDVIVMEDAQGRVIDAVRGIWNQGIGPRFFKDPQPQTETTYKIRISGIIELTSFQYPFAVKKVLDWSTFKTAQVTNLGYAESVPTSVPTWFKNFEYMFSLAYTFNWPALHYNGTDVLTWNMENAISVIGMFQGNVRFNQPINWKLPLVPVNGFDYMLNYASAFNQDLKGWCTTVTNPGQISNFADFSLMQPENYPIWGTCPAPHNT